MYLTEEQKEELKDTYRSIIHHILNTSGARQDEVIDEEEEYLIHAIEQL